MIHFAGFLAPGSKFQPDWLWAWSSVGMSLKWYMVPSSEHHTGRKKLGRMEE